MENLKTFLIIGGISAFAMFLFAFYVMHMPFNLALFLASIIPITMLVVWFLSKYHELKNRK